MWSRSAKQAKPAKPIVGPEDYAEAFITVELQVPEMKSQLLGDAGWSFPSRHRPQRLERWMAGHSLPEDVQRLTRAHAGLGKLRGVLRMRLSRAESDDSVWILTRATDSLVGILVREAADRNVAEFEMDASILVAQARRYCCTAALLLVEGRNRVDEFGAFRAFVMAHGEAGPVVNRLYPLTDTRPRLFCAYLR